MADHMAALDARRPEEEKSENLGRGARRTSSAQGFLVREGVHEPRQQFSRKVAKAACYISSLGAFKDMLQNRSHTSNPFDPMLDCQDFCDTNALEHDRTQASGVSPDSLGITQKDPAEFGTGCNISFLPPPKRIRISRQLCRKGSKCHVSQLATWHGMKAVGTNCRLIAGKQSVPRPRVPWTAPSLHHKLVKNHPHVKGREERILAAAQPKALAREEIARNSIDPGFKIAVEKGLKPWAENGVTETRPPSLSPKDSQRAWKRGKRTQHRLLAMGSHL